MYTGDTKISSLNAFLNGYSFSKHIDSVDDSKDFPPFWYFHEWAMEKYNWRESTAGWKNIILKENNNDEEISLKVFFEMIDDFKKLHPVSIQRLKISNKSLAFHYSDECKTKIIGSDLSDRKPVYDKVDEILLAEFSHSFGFSYFVVNKKRLVGTDWTKRFKDIKSTKENVELLFGPQNEWEHVAGDLTTVLKQIL
jgi:hypothetical protein